MVASSWLTAALGVASLMISVNGAFEESGFGILSNKGAPGTAMPSPYDFNTQHGPDTTKDDGERWGGFKPKTEPRQSYKGDNTRNGNWTNFDCTHDAISTPFDFTPSEKWTLLNADAAWKDAIRIWEGTDRPQGLSFMYSVSSTFKMGHQSDCGSVSASSDCGRYRECERELNREYSGPAANLIYNSLIKIHNYYREYHTAMSQFSAMVNSSLDSFEKKFASVSPEDDAAWKQVLIDSVTLGSVSVTGTVFSSFLKEEPYFINHATGLDEIRDTTTALIKPNLIIADDVLFAKDYPWLPVKKGIFSRYMSQAVDGWSNISSLALAKVFDGSPESIEVLWKAIAGGKLITGMIQRHPPRPVRSNTKAVVGRAFFGYSIPALWNASKTYAFVLDSGNECGKRESLRQYMTEETMNATGACIHGKAYYLVHPKGRASSSRKFSAPLGLDLLSGSNYDFDGITKEDLIKGSIRTYLRNGKRNDTPSTDPSHNTTIENLLSADASDPGYVRIPVCSPERAFQSWSTTTAGSSPNYPCDIAPGQDKCGDSTFENQSSDASPKIEDCRQIIEDIKGDGRKMWTTQTAFNQHKNIVSHGSCHFGVEASGRLDGNINFKVGAQDVIDIINNAIEKFAWNGKIGAKGTMPCNGNMKQQSVKWGIY